MVALGGAEISGILIVLGIGFTWLAYRAVTRPAWSGREERDGRRGSPGANELIGKRCSVCGEWVRDAYFADACPECDLPYHLDCAEDHRCHQEWVAEDD